MSCTPEVIEARQVTNEQVAYRIVCCGEKCSQETCQPDAHSCEDTWHTLHLAVTDHDGQLEARKAEIAERHEMMKAWREKQEK